MAMFLWPLAHAVAQEDFDWSKIDRTGIYTTNEDGLLDKDIWKGYSQQKAISTIASLPNQLNNPQYRLLAKKLLLSQSSESRDEIESPAFLTARINKLISYGLFSDAIDLYQKAQDISENKTDFGMSMIGIQMTLMNGSLAPVCLDIQADSNNFRDMPAWRELSDFCRLRFGSVDKIKMDSLSFKTMPILDRLLKTDSVDIREPRSNIGTLIAFMDNKINPETYNGAARTVGDLDDLKIKLALDKRFADLEAYQCYAIEATKRGIINPKELEIMYQAITFPNDLLNGSSGEVKLHPCAVPAFFYQRLKIAQSPEESRKNVNIMMSVTKNIPAIALSPMAKDIESYVDKDHQWRAAVILAMLGITIPDSFDTIVWPLQNIQKTNQIGRNDYNEWLNNDNHGAFLKNENRDPALLLYISSILTSDFTKFEEDNKNKEYENFFSLTYAKKSLHLGLGFNDFIRLAYDNKDTASVISHILSLAGDHDLKTMHPNDISVILSAYKAYKLEKEAVVAGLEYLQ